MRLVIGGNLSFRDDQPLRRPPFTAAPVAVLLHDIIAFVLLRSRSFIAALFASKYTTNHRKN